MLHRESQFANALLSWEDAFRAAPRPSTDLFCRARSLRSRSIPTHTSSRGAVTQTLSGDLDDLLDCIDTCTSRALAALDGSDAHGRPSAPDIAEAQRWVVSIRKAVFDFIINADDDSDDSD